MYLAKPGVGLTCIKTCGSMLSAMFQTSNREYRTISTGSPISSYEQTRW